jgi:hypothetical protein
MTKAGIFAFGICRDNIPYLNITIGNNHPINEQFNQLTLLLKARSFQTFLHTLTEFFYRCDQCRHVVLMINLQIQLRLLASECLYFLFDLTTTALIFHQGNDLSQIGFSQAVKLLFQLNTTIA